MFDIKTLFEANHPGFAQKHPVVTRMIVKVASFIWMEEKFQTFAGEHEGKSDSEFLSSCLEHINCQFMVSDDDRVKIPKSGRLILIANHPMGNLDGIGLLEVVAKIRPDVKLLVSPTLHAMLGMENLTIPIDNYSTSLSKDSFRQIRDHLDNDGVIIIFPSGRYSELRNGKVTDYQWKGSFLKFSRDKKAPILPVYIGGKNTNFYYFLVRIASLMADRHIMWARELVQMRMMREIFSTHQDARIPLVFGEIFTAADIDQKYSSAHEKINAVRNDLYALAPEE